MKISRRPAIERASDAGRITSPAEDILFDKLNEVIDRINQTNESHQPMTDKFRPWKIGEDIFGNRIGILATGPDTVFKHEPTPLTAEEAREVLAWMEPGLYPTSLETAVKKLMRLADFPVERDTPEMTGHDKLIDALENALTDPAVPQSAYGPARQALVDYIESLIAERIVVEEVDRLRRFETYVEEAFSKLSDRAIKAENNFCAFHTREYLFAGRPIHRKAIEVRDAEIDELREKVERLRRFETYVCQIIAMGHQASLTVESLPK